MKFEDFSKNQQEAIKTKGHNIIVSAGAGSGKTEVLSQRVVYFIKNYNCNINDFIVLTFTDLAANELKQRIREKIIAEGLDKENNVDLASICTFDSYSLDLVKKYHMNLHLDSDVKVIDSRAIHLKKLQIIASILDSYYVNPTKEFDEYVLNYIKRDDDFIYKLVIAIHDKAMISDNKEEFLDNFISKCYSFEIKKEFIHTHEEEVLNDFNRLKNILIPKGTSINLIEELMKILELKFGNYLQDSTYENFMNDLMPEQKKPNIRINKTLREIENQVKDFSSELSKVKSKYKSYPKTLDEINYYFEENKKFASFIIQIVKEFDKKVFEYKKEHNAFEFVDIELLAISILEKFPNILSDIKSHTKMIMIDEYQDTSFLQEKFVNLISDNNAYMVGDVKQSIYSFRNARCDLFEAKYQRYKNKDGGICFDLNQNFRSRYEVLDDINYIFKQIMTSDLGQADYLHQHVIESGNGAYKKYHDEKHSNHLETIYYGGKASAEIEANIIAKDILKKINDGFQVYDKANNGLRNCRFSDFCILIEKSTSFETISKVLQLYQIPVAIQSNDNIINNDLVNILINLFKVVNSCLKNDYSKLKHPLVSLLRSFVFNYDDEKIYNLIKNKTLFEDKAFKSIQMIIYQNRDLPVYDLILKVLEEINFELSFIKIGDYEKNEAILSTYLSVFKSMCELNFSLDDFVLYLDDVKNNDLKFEFKNTLDVDSSVKLMNIHQSKGLEFNIIYFPLLTISFNLKDLNQIYNYSPKYGLVLPYPKGKYPYHLLMEMNKKTQLKDVISEKIRLFYVALTRAKEKMIFVINDNADYEFSKAENNICLTNKYIKLLPNNNKIKFIYDLFLHHNFDDEVLLNLLKYCNFRVPYEFYKMTYEDKIKCSYEKLLEIKEEENEELKNLKDLCLLSDVDLLNKYLKKEIDKKDFDIVLMDREYIYNEKQEFEPIYKKINYKKYAYDNIVSNAINGYVNEKITLDELNKFLAYFSYSYDHDLNYIEQEEDKNLIENIRKEAILNKDAKTLSFIDGGLIYSGRIMNFVLRALENKKNIDILEKVVSLIGYEFSNILKEKIKNYDNDKYIFDHLNEFEAFKLNSAYFEITINMKEQHQDDFINRIIFNKFKNQEIDENTFKLYLDALNEEENVDFKKLDINEKLNYSDEHMAKIISKIGTILPYDSCLTNFYSIIITYLDYPYFKKDYYKTYEEVKMLNNEKEVSDEKIVLKEFEFKSNEIKEQKISKKLNLEAKKSNLRFGSKLHETLEIIDFKNPDYSFIEEKNVLFYIKRFLKSNLMKNVKNASIYKEFEYFNENENENGIIDLMLVYDDHIDVIDYKTKNIEDLSYEKQVKTYCEYIEKRYKKVVKGYLYSLIEGSIKQVR